MEQSNRAPITAMVLWENPLFANTEAYRKESDEEENETKEVHVR
jgi:hypothetical protein